MTTAAPDEPIDPAAIAATEAYLRNLGDGGEPDPGDPTATRLAALRDEARDGTE